MIYVESYFGVLNISAAGGVIRLKSYLRKIQHHAGSRCHESRKPPCTLDYKQGTENLSDMPLLDYNYPIGALLAQLFSFIDNGSPRRFRYQLPVLNLHPFPVFHRHLIPIGHIHPYLFQIQVLPSCVLPCIWRA